MEGLWLTFAEKVALPAVDRIFCRKHVQSLETEIVAVALRTRIRGWIFLGDAVRTIIEEGGMRLAFSKCRQ
ncbi:hypothetical protein CFB52_028525 [Burkholderia sp. AU18528]|nr:hypothetical protein CFB52_028525 [Burkholderia sp. AU18528]